jgi:hypothetical protein
MLVRRDNYNRTELHRFKTGEGKCQWCGQIRKTTFRYVIQTDGGRTISDTTPFSGIRKSGPFCSVGCFQDYNHG